MTLHKRLWRHFEPRGFRPPNVPHDISTRSLFETALALADQMYPSKRVTDAELATGIQSVRAHATAQNDPVQWATALILQAPRAASAQEQMDRHPHGYRDKQARLYELIDFNDTYVSTVLSMPEHELSAFTDNAKYAMDAFCKRLKRHTLTNEQYSAIVHGLSREIAVFRAAAREGFEASMTNRTEDAMGIDMVITDESIGKSINIDCKTHSSFYYRLKELRREGRISADEADHAEVAGYCEVVNGHDNEQVEVVLLRIDEETYGSIRDFSFEDTSRLGERLAEIISRHGR